MTVHDAPPPQLEEPPVPTGRVLIVGLIGVGLLAAALVFGLATGAPTRGFDHHWADGPRALLACAGLLVAGAAVSMRPGWFGGWLCASAAGLIGYGVGLPPPAGTEWYEAPPRDWFAGVPDSWDSVQLFFGVAAVIGLIGAAWIYLPRRVVLSLILAGVAFHFTGILSAITSPPPTPFLADQYWRRVGRPYLLFMYLNNAYQFYSPDPGPATEIWVCVQYKVPDTPDNDPDAPKECRWVYIPRRAEHYKDPLGLSYYRRLSITENIAQYPPRGYRLPPAEEEAARKRRMSDEGSQIPIYGHPDVQRIIPSDLVIRHVLPSYARHLAYANRRPDREIKGIKIYRTTHTIISLDQFVGFDASTNSRVAPRSPYNPILYMPYYQGDYDVAGHLKNPTSPMLYWLVPIVEAADPPASDEEYRKNGGFKHYFTDYVSKHAGCERPVD